MRVFNSLDEIQNIKGAAIALGNFDGVHMGHRELIRRTMNTAGEKGLKSGVFTFSTHPAALTGNRIIKNIIYNEEKIEIIEKLGIDYLFNIPFTEKIMVLRPQEFIEKLLLENFNMKEAHCGFNYRFGLRAEGTPEFLEAEGRKMGFGVHILEPFMIDGNLVSSTFIRSLIEEGRVDLCRQYMGRNYGIEGEVVVGNRLGKTIGFPTSNLNVDEGMVSPPNGVYITECSYNGVLYPSITNVGNRPTIGKFAKNVETHIFNFDSELYGKTIKVEFLKKLRDEIKFPSVEALSKEIRANCITAKEFHRERGSLQV